MKYTLLELTQSILSSLNSDSVNSISDTVESAQVAEVIRSSYFNLLARLNLAEHNQLFQLTASGDSTKPVLMTRPDGVTKIEWIKYFNEELTPGGGDFIHSLNVDIDQSDYGSEVTPPGFQTIKIIPVRQLIDMVNTFDTDQTNVDTFQLSVINAASGITNTFDFKYKTDKSPEYCAVIQDYFVVFDSFDSDVDSTLQSSKSMCMGWITPYFLMEDGFIPNIDEQQFPLLLNEAKSLAFLELKQMPHPKAEKEVSRQMGTVQKYKSVVNRPSYFNELPNFGRR